MMKEDKVPRILIVDDEKDFQILIQQRFRKQIQENRFEFVFAHNGIEALDILKNSAPIDTLITDIHMPGMDGLQLLGEVSFVSPQTRSIVLSAYDDLQNLRRAMNCGAYDFLTKPVNFMELEEILDKSLSLKKNPEMGEREWAPKDPSLLSLLQIVPLFPANDPKIILDIFSVMQGCYLLLLVARQRADVSKIFLIKMREVLRTLSLEMPGYPAGWIKSVKRYQEIFNEASFGIVGGWMDLGCTQLKIASFPENAFFFQATHTPHQKILQGDFHLFSGETIFFYKTPEAHALAPLISFRHSLVNA